VEKGGHHSFFYNTIIDSLEGLGEFVSVTNFSTLGLKNDSIRSCLYLAKKKDCNIVILPFIDPYILELCKYPKSYDENCRSICLWLDPLCFKTHQIQKIVDKTKKIIIRQLLKRNIFLRAATILTLDEYATPSMKKIWNDVHWLPDPPPFPTPHYVNKEKEFDFLLYGAITRRKGLHIVLKAMNILLGKGINCNLKILGQITPYPLKEDELHIFNGLLKSGNIEIVDRWVEDEEIIRAIQESSTVLLPYENFYASSGILTTACAFNKKIIASDIGTIGMRVKTHNLGELFRSGNPNSLADVMMRSLNAPVPVQSQDSFVERNQLKKFKEIFRDSVKTFVRSN